MPGKSNQILIFKEIPTFHCSGLAIHRVTLYLGRTELAISNQSLNLRQGIAVIVIHIVNIILVIVIMRHFLLRSSLTVTGNQSLNLR
jgi:hypothetical protein